MPEKEMELNEVRAMVYVPEDAVECIMSCKVFVDGELYTAEKKLTMRDRREAIRKAEDGYIDEDDVFTLTDKGREWFEHHGQ